MRRIPALSVLCLVVFAAGAAPRAQTAAPAPFPLTVESIMRGPDLVGYPPDNLRWSADSGTLYFDWRRPGEDEASTYSVGRDGGAPVKLTDEQKKRVPPASARWDKAHKRALFADRGDIILLEGGSRRVITRTTAAEGSPRWARHETAITYVREGNLYLVPLDSGGVQQLTDNGPKKADPRLTDSQKFMRSEEEKLLDAVKDAKEKKQKAEQKDKQDKLPSLELHDRQSAVDLMLSPDDTHVFVLVSERPAGARNVIVPNWVNETGYVEDIPGRTAVGDAQNRLLLAVLNVKSGTFVWADGSFADAKDAKDAKEREIRWSMPAVSDDGQFAVAGARSADNKDRWYVRIDAETGQTHVVDTLHDDAWIREVGGGFASPGVAFMPDGKRVWFLSERDGWMHLYTLDVSDASATPKQLTSGRWEVTSAELARDGRTFYITTTETHPGERHLYALSADGGTRTKITSMTGSNEGEVSPDG
jgi:Tol biopolymer transport system component